MASRSQADETEIAGERDLVGDDEVPLARDAFEKEIAGETDADAGFDEIDHGFFLIGEADPFRQRAERSEDVVEQPPVRGRRGGRKPWQAGEVGPILSLDPVAPFRRGDDAVCVAQQRRHREFAVLDAALAMRMQRRSCRCPVDIVTDIEFAPADLGEHVVAHAVAEEYLGLVRRGGEASDEWSEPRELGIQDCSDPEHAALRLLQRARRRYELERRRHGLVGKRKQGRSRFRQRETARRPVEELQAGCLLKPLQLKADGRLGQVQQGRGPRYGTFTCNRNEAAQGLGTREIAHLECL
jgi:hypothetical protein